MDRNNSQGVDFDLCNTISSSLLTSLLDMQSGNMANKIGPPAGN